MNRGVDLVEMRIGIEVPGDVTDQSPCIPVGCVVSDRDMIARASSEPPGNPAFFKRDP
jgi:hypothetical protein